MCRAVCKLRKDLRRTQLSPLVDFRALHKQEVKTKARLSIAWQRTDDMPQHAHKGLLQELETYWLKEFKERSEQLLADN